MLLVLLFLLGWLLVSFFGGNLISITGSFQLLTDHVSHLSGNAGKKKHRGARGVYPTPWPPTCSGVLPSWCTIEVASLLVVTEEAAILDVPGRLSQCTCQRRGKRWDHSLGAGFSQQWYKGSYSMHNPALLAKRIVLVKRSDGGLLPRMGNSTQT